MAVSLLEARRQILLNTPRIATASGSIATFNTDMSANLQECKIHFYPVQEGTGDPSPDNVRPITGWDGVTVHHSGSDRTTPVEIPISFGRTIYGGYVDLVKGEVVETWGYKDEGSLNWNHQNTSSAYPYGFYYVNITGKNKGLSNILYSNYPVTSAVFSNDKVGFGNAQNSVIYIINSDYANVGDFKIAMNDQIISYELTTPNTYPLTPQTIKSLKGINNIWSDANGDVEVKFWKH